MENITLSKNRKRIRRHTGITKRSMTLPTKLVEMIDCSAEIEGVSRSAFTAQLVFDGFGVYMQKKYNPLLEALKECYEKKDK